MRDGAHDAPLNTRLEDGLRQPVPVREGVPRSLALGFTQGLPIGASVRRALVIPSHPSGFRRKPTLAWDSDHQGARLLETPSPENAKASLRR